MVDSKDTNKCCAVDIEKRDTFDFMANVIGLSVLHPGGLRELGVLKAIKIALNQLFNTTIKRRMNEIDNFIKRNDEYFGYGIYVGQKIVFFCL